MNARKITATLLLVWIVCVALSAALKPAAVNITSTHVTPTTEAGPTDAATNVPYKETTLSQLENEGRSIAPIGTNELDGRHAYINNNYVTDGEMLSYNDSALPLYQILQQQMENILSSSVPGEYRLENKGAITETATDGAVGKETNVDSLPVLQSNANSAALAYGATNFKEDEDDMVGAYRKDGEQIYYEGTASTKPSTMELPKPLIAGATEVRGVGLRPQLPTTTAATEAPKHPTGGYGAQLVLPASQPATAPSQQSKPAHLLTREDYSPTPNNYTYVHQNSTVHMRKRRITFQTVASTSQIISTPLADLMFKYSIGVAKPSTSAGGDSLGEPDVQPIRNAISTGYNDNIDLPKRAYAPKISHSSYRENL